ncbi:MAG: PKD domain-containing protein [Bacteroidetes bacterium]|nr:PKD domain-containing protein [Bacteroidota bacterium]
MKRCLLVLLLAGTLSLIGSKVQAQCPPTVQIQSLFYTTIINGNNVSFCSGDSCKLVATPSGGVTYQWYHNGGVITTRGTNSVYYPTLAGDYYLIISGCGTPSATIHVVINPLPNGSITVSPTPPICTGSDVTITLNTDFTLNNWNWEAPYTGNPPTFTQQFLVSNVVEASLRDKNTNCSRVVGYYIVVHDAINPGTISADQIICSGTAPNLLTGTAPSGGDGTFTYQWMSSTISDVNGFTNIPGATDPTYQPGILTQTTWFRRMVSSNSPCPSSYTNAVKITVNARPIVTSAVTKSICSGNPVAYVPTSDVAGSTFAWTGLTTSPTVTVYGVTPVGSGTINDVLSIDPGGSSSGEVTYTIIPTGPAPTMCPGTPKNLVVTVKPLPIPVITGPNSVCFGSTGVIYSTAGGKTGYTWTIQGGVITSGQNTNSIIVNWTVAGSQWVRVTYSENGCAAATPTQYNVTVNPLPVPVIIGPNPACQGSTGNVYSTAAGMTNYGWLVSSGGTITGGGGSSDNNVTVTWNNSGVQWVKVTYTDANGCTNTSPTQYNVNVSIPSLTGPQSPCLGSNNSVYTTDPGMSSYQWTVSAGGNITSGGTSTDNTVTVTWNGAGSQTVTVNYTSGAGCMAGTPTTIIVNVHTLPVPSISGSSSVCAGSTGNIYTTQTGQSNYLWTLSAGGTLTGGGTTISNTATVTWNTPGAQWVKVNYTDANGCTAASPIQYDVTVKPLPVPGITGSTSECAGATGITYTTEAGKTGYSWTISGGNITSGSNSNTVTVTWTTAGPGWVAVNYTDVNGCQAAAATQHAVTVRPLPVPVISGAASVCVNATNVMYSTQPGMTNYQWSVSAGGTITGVSNTDIVYVTWNAAGPQTVSVSYTGSNGCTAATPSVYNVTVNPLPTITISGPNDVCKNSTGNVYTTQPGMSNYTWSVSAGGSITSGGTTSSNTATVTWNDQGAQTVTVNYQQTGCPAAAPFTFNVNVNPLPTANAGLDQLIPYGTSTTLTGVPGGGTPTLSYLWTPAANINGPNNTASVLTTNLTVNPTTFTFTVNDSKGCIASDMMQVTLNGTALAVSATATPQVICNNGASVQLNANATGGNSAVQHDYTWTSTPAGFTSTDQNPLVNPTQTITYHVSVWDGYNTATNSVLVTVNPLPTQFGVTGGGEYCSGGTGLPVGLDGSETGVNYDLKLGGTIIGSMPGSGSAISFGNKTAGGTYTIVATNATTNCVRNMSGSALITVNPVPTASTGGPQTIPYGTSTSLTGTASGGTAPLFYLWTPVNMIASGGTTLGPLTTNIYANQTYTLTVTDSKGCTQSSQTQVNVTGSAVHVDATVNPSTICDGSPAQLMATGTGGSGSYYYSWVCAPGTWTSNAPDPVVTPSVTTLYTVTINDGYNTATASVTVTVNPLPALQTVTGGGSYCSGGPGVPVGLSGSQVGVDYKLYIGGVYSATVPGTSVAISFGNQTAGGSYTVKATRVLTGCETWMTGTATVSILPLPQLYSMTGGGSYPAGGIGVIVGLTNSQLGINYRLLNNTDTLTPAPGIAGTGSPFDFGYQTLAGPYTAVAKNPVTECVSLMLGSVNVIINPYPSLFKVFGGGTICLGDAGKIIGLDGSEFGVRYVLRRDGDSIAAFPATGDTLFFGFFNTPGVYTVKAVNIATGLVKIMNGSATIVVNPLPVAYLLVPVGDTCPGTEVLLNGSQSGVMYYLIAGTDTVASQAGTGLPGLLSFGNQYIPAVFRAVGVNITTHCKMDMIGSVIIQPAPAIFNLTPPGFLCPGQVLTLSGSETGILYQLRRDSLINVGPPITGTGSSLDFGPQLLPGIYRVVATNLLSHCYSWQNGRSLVQPGPVRFTIIPNGDTCAGGRVRLDGSQTGIHYHLILNNTIYLDSLFGTGQSLVFGTYTTTGFYRILAVDTLTHCTDWMDGLVNVTSAPLAYNVIPNGMACAGSTVGLDNSEPGMSYTLILNHSIIAGGPITGTGFPISFGIQNTAGDYTVEANVISTACSKIMTGMASLSPNPTSFLLMPQGTFCPGINIYLNGSKTGVNYQLIRGGLVQQTLPGSGNILDFGVQTIAGVYTIKAVNVITTCDTLMTGSATIIQGPFAFNITPSGANCSPTVIGLTGSETGIKYQLVKNGGTLGSSVTGTGFPLTFGQQTDGTYRIVALSISTLCSDTMNGTVTISPGPTIHVGNDTTICATHSVALHADAHNYSTIHWITSGGGTFSDNSAPNTIYFPDQTDISLGTVTISSSVQGAPECPLKVATDTLLLSIHPFPVVTAGNNDTICITQTYTLNPTVSFDSVITWRTAGNGHFDNIHIKNPVYTPGSTDKASGQVRLTITVHGTLQCYSDTASSSMILYIEPLPIAYAGKDDTICENMKYRLAFAYSQHSSSVLWSTTGDGSFDNDAIPTPFYTPGPNDKNTGRVKLILIAVGSLPCISEVNRDTMLLLIDKLPVVIAGRNDTICAGQSFLTSASAQPRSSLTWTTSGDGTFDDQHKLGAIYFPGTADTISGLVQLKLTAWGTMKCASESVSDTILLRIIHMPVVNAGTDTLACSNIAIPLHGRAWHYSAVQWASLGDGQFDNNTLLRPNYTPGAADISLGHVFLTMSVNGLMQCGSHLATDTVRVDLRQLPLAVISGNQTICAGDATTLSISLSGTTPWSFVYTDGTSNYPVNNVLVSPYIININPLVNTTYSIVSMHDAYCSANYPISSFTIGVYPKPNTYNTVVGNGGHYCVGGNGVTIGTDGSESGILYQLLWGGTLIGSPVPGTGNPISFGLFTDPGVYKVKAYYPNTVCQSIFHDSAIVIVYPIPVVDFLIDSTCYGLATQFHISGPDISRIAQWNWDFGDGHTATYTSPVEPTHLYQSLGTFMVTLSVSDTNGCQKTQVHYVTVHPLPVALFAYSAPLCYGLPVSFTDHSYCQGTSTIKKWHWEFGDGRDTLIIWPGNPDISHLYASAGNFTVKLTVYTEQNCSSERTNTIQVLPAPLADFDHSTSCTNSAVMFTDLSQPNGGSSIIQWAWNFGDPGSGINNTSSNQNATHIYHTSGTYQVKLVVWSAIGCIDTIVKPIQVMQQPKAMFTAGPTCESNPTQFTDNSIPNATAIIEWDWDFGDGSPHSNLQNPVHLYAISGQFNVSLWVKNSNQCTHDTTLSVTVVAKPVALFNTNAPQCMGKAVAFMNLSTTQYGQIVKWKWTFGDGTDTIVVFPGVPNVSHVFTGTASQHLVRLTVTTNDSCSNYIEQIINSVPQPAADFSYSTTRCVGQSVSFTDNTQLNGGGVITGWNWNFGDPSSGSQNISTLQNPVHIFTNAASYNVVLIVTNLNSCTDAISHPVSIGNAPQANFRSDTACLGTPTQFTDLSTPNATSITAWDWNFGDGSPHLYIKNPVHQYNTSGIFAVTLTVTNSNGCTHSVTKQANVTPAPSPAFSFSQNNCMGTAVSFYDFSTTLQGYIVTWKWYFGDGDSTIVNLPNSQNVTHVYATAGTFNVNLVVITNHGCSGSVTHQVNVAAGPLANFNFASTRCQDEPLHFQDNSQTNGGGVLITWNWDFGDPGSGINNNSSMQNPFHIYSSGGTYQVKLIVLNINNCSDTIIKPVIVSSKPSAHYKADTVCKGSPTQFTDQSAANSGSIISWNWSFGDGVTSTLPNPTHTYAQAGVYNAILTVLNSFNCQSDTTGQVLVKAPPAALFSHDNACSGSATQFHDLSTTTAGVINKWHWEFGDGDTSNLQNPSHTYATAGIYNVVLTVTSTQNCSDSFSMQVSVYIRPSADYSYLSQHCPKGRVAFSDHSTSSGAPIVAWLWIFEPGYTSSSQNPTYIFPVTDTTYQVSLIITDANGCKDTLIQPVIVVPGMSFTFSADTSCYGHSTHFIPVNQAQGDVLHDLQWNFGDPNSGTNNQSNLFNPTHEFTAPGTFIVKLSAYNSDNCKDSIYKEVIVHSNPVSDFSFDTIPYCDSIVTFHNISVVNASAIDTLVWVFGDGNTVVQTRPVPPTVVHKYLSFGSFTVSLRIVNTNGCSDVSSKSVLVSCLNAQFKDLDTLKCQRQTVMFNDSSGPVSLIKKWYWAFGDGKDTTYTHFKRTIQHKYSLSGDYTVMLVVSLTSNGITLTDTNRIGIHVRSTPVAGFTAAAVCFKDSTRFINVSDSNGYSIVATSWRFGDSGSGVHDTSTLADPAHWYSTNGKFHPVLVIKNNLGCTDTLKKEVRVYKLPQSLFLTPEPCTRQYAFFTDKSKPGDTVIAKWNWTFGDTGSDQDTSVRKNPSHTYHKAGKYYVYLKVKDYFGCQNTGIDSVAVRESPVSAFTFTDNVEGVTGKVQFNNKSENAVTYEWNFGNGKTSNEVDPQVTYEEDGTYIIKLTATGSNLCEDTTTTKYEFIFHGLYVPNLFAPTSLTYQVRFFKPAGINLADYHITVYDISGHTLWESSALDTEGRPLEGWDGTFNGNLLPQGTYMWKISATFKDGKAWEGSNTGKGSTTTMGTVTLVR